MQLFAALQASFRSASIGSENRKSTLALAAVVAVILSLAVVLLPFAPGFPSFFVNAVGTTDLDWAVYALAISAFFLAGFLFLRLYFSSRATTMYWYSLALLLWGSGR